jgi:glutamine---fructose-6-phosphate transaminase (isomerizing)
MTIGNTLQMCGIVGYLGNREARQILVDCLSRLDARGYDSAGIGMVAGGKLKTLRSMGNSSGLKAALKRTPLPGKIGIAHSYWAPEGDSATVYPHTDCTSSLAVVHAGQIDNHAELRAELISEGHQLGSNTDSEVIAHLLERNGGSLETALRATLPLLRGKFSLVVLSQHEPDKIIAARQGGAPLLIGHRHDAYFVASELPAISHYTRAIQTLEDGELAIIAYGGVRISKLDGTPVLRPLAQAPAEDATLQ